MQAGDVAGSTVTDVAWLVITRGSFMKMHLVNAIEEVPYQGKVARMLSNVRSHECFSTFANLDSCRSGDEARFEWYTADNEYGFGDTDLEIRLP